MRETPAAFNLAPWTEAKKEERVMKERRAVKKIFMVGI